MYDFKAGEQVVCPVTDKEGEVAHRVGTLIRVNKRFAYVEVDGVEVKVGCTKIEAFCPTEEEEISAGGNGRRDRSEYTCVKSASGRKSLDNNDGVAISLRGATLNDAYRMASKVLAIPQYELRAKYQHLNNGQQRMCLGNRIRHAKG